MSFVDVPLSESSVTLKLSEIQKRCSELMNDSESEFGDLSLVDHHNAEFDRNNPYSRG